jgi:hypothetical protein
MSTSVHCVQTGGDAPKTGRRDELLAIQKEAQKKWEELKVFEVDAPEGGSPVPEGRFFGNFPYPYMNGVLHLGHAFSISKLEFASAFHRLLGKRVLFPQGFHCTGEHLAFIGCARICYACQIAMSQGHAGAGLQCSCVAWESSACMLRKVVLWASAVPRCTTGAQHARASRCDCSGLVYFFSQSFLCCAPLRAVLSLLQRVARFGIDLVNARALSAGHRKH